MPRQMGFRDGDRDTEEEDEEFQHQIPLSALMRHIAQSRGFKSHRNKWVSLGPIEILFFLTKIVLRVI